MALKDLLPTLGILLAAVVGLGTYAWQSILKRREELVKRRETLYDNLVRNLVELLVAKSAAQRSKITTEIEKGWLFASDEVLRASYEYLNIYDRLCCPPGQQHPVPVDEMTAKIRSDQNVKRELSESLARIFLAMRRDIRSDSTITTHWAEQNLKFYNWGAIAESK